MSAESHPLMFRIRQGANINIWWRDNSKPGEGVIGVSGEFVTDKMQSTLYNEHHVRQYLNGSDSLPSEFILELQPQRFKDAIAINEGAVNVQAISRALVRASREVVHERVGTAAKDPAVILIVHQLAHLVGMTGGLDLADYMRAVEACKAKGQ